MDNVFLIVFVCGVSPSHLHACTYSASLYNKHFPKPTTSHLQPSLSILNFVLHLWRNSGFFFLFFFSPKLQDNRTEGSGSRLCVFIIDFTVSTYVYTIFPPLIRQTEKLKFHFSFLCIVSNHSKGQPGNKVRN